MDLARDEKPKNQFVRLKQSPTDVREKHLGDDGEGKLGVRDGTAVPNPICLIVIKFPHSLDSLLSGLGNR